MGLPQRENIMETKFAERTLEQMLSEVADKLWESMQEDGLGESDAWHGADGYDVNVYIDDHDTVKAVAYPMKLVSFYVDGQYHTTLSGHHYDRPIYLWEKPL
jgi:hypothetical protein